MKILADFINMVELVSYGFITTAYKASNLAMMLTCTVIHNQHGVCLRGYTIGKQWIMHTVVLQTRDGSLGR